MIERSESLFQVSRKILGSNHAKRRHEPPHICFHLFQRNVKKWTSRGRPWEKGESRKGEEVRAEKWRELAGAPRVREQQSINLDSRPQIQLCTVHALITNVRRARTYVRVHTSFKSDKCVYLRGAAATKQCKCTEFDRPCTRLRPRINDRCYLRGWPDVKLIICHTRYLRVHGVHGRVCVAQQRHSFSGISLNEYSAKRGALHERIRLPSPPSNICFFFFAWFFLAGCFDQVEIEKCESLTLTRNVTLALV